jgi:uncharacterized SAM-binding protein YcdF (DUF218 family)
VSPDKGRVPAPPRGTGMSNVYFFLKELLEPYTVCFLLAAATLGYAWYREPGARRRLLWLTLPFAGLTLLSLPALASLGLGSLEGPYPPLREPPAGVEALVVLGGSIRPADAVRPEAEPGEDTVYGCLYAARLYRQIGPCPVVVSGRNSSSNGPSDPSCAQVMRTFLTDLGVSGRDISTEDDSTTTYENAVNCRKLLEPRGVRRVVLVTDADHMFRAERCFRRQGFDVVPAPCNYRATRFGSALDFVPRARAVRHWRKVFHEWFGTLWYWWRGRI